MGVVYFWGLNLYLLTMNLVALGCSLHIVLVFGSFFSFVLDNHVTICPHSGTSTIVQFLIFLYPEQILFCSILRLCLYNPSLFFLF